MDNSRRFSLIKPTIETPFHIDFDWWKQHDNNWRIFLHSCLCNEHQEAFHNIESDSQIDWIDPETAEVFSVDGLQHTLMTHCANQAEFITQNTTLINAVFRTLLAQGNSPATPEELSAVLGKPPHTILKTLTGPRVYKGIRPIQQNN